MGVEGRLLNVLGWTGVWLPAAKFKKCNEGSESAQPSIGASTRPQPSGSSNIGWAHDAVALICLNYFNYPKFLDFLRSLIFLDFIDFYSI